MKFRFNKALMVPLAALGVGTAAALLANSHIKSSIEAAKPRALVGEMVERVVATKDLAKGTRLATNNLSIRKVPRDWAHSNAVTPTQFEQVKDLELALPAQRGEQLLWSQIEGKKAPTLSSRLISGRRAVTVAVDEISSISGMLSPGDAIDLVASVKNAGRSTMVPVLQAVYVLATGTRVEQTAADGQRSYTTVTLDVNPQEARRIMAAREVGRLTALLRAPGDRQPTLLGTADAHAELGLSVGPKLMRDNETVPVIAGRGNQRMFAVASGAAHGQQSMEDVLAKMMSAAAVSEARPSNQPLSADAATPTSSGQRPTRATPSSVRP